VKLLRAASNEKSKLNEVSGTAAPSENSKLNEVMHTAEFATEVSGASACQSSEVSPESFPAEVNPTGEFGVYVIQALWRQQTQIKPGHFSTKPNGL
jgi:hypothetical protein